MGERAKLNLNKFQAKAILQREDLNLDRFYSSDLKLMIEVLKEELKKKINIIDEFEKNLKRYDLQYLHETGEHQLAYAIEDMIDTLKELKEEANK